MPGSAKPTTWNCFICIVCCVTQISATTRTAAFSESVRNNIAVLFCFCWKTHHKLWDSGIDTTVGPVGLFCAKFV